MSGKMNLSPYPLLQKPEESRSSALSGYTTKEAPAAYPAQASSRIALVRTGLPPECIQHFQAHTGLQRTELAQALGVSERSLLRYPTQKALPAAVSERLLRLHDIYQMGSVLGGPPEVSAWLRTPNTALGGEAPITLLDTFAGMQLVEQVLGRLEWGLVS